MVKSALFVVVLIFDLARVDLEPAENQILVEILLKGLRVVGLVHDLLAGEVIWGKHCEVVPRECQVPIIHVIILWKPWDINRGEPITLNPCPKTDNSSWAESPQDTCEEGHGMINRIKILIMGSDCLRSQGPALMI